MASDDGGNGRSDADRRPVAGSSARPRPAITSSSTGRELHSLETVRGLFPGDRYLRVRRHRDFRRGKSGHLVLREGVSQSKGPVSTAISRLKRLLIGRPIPTAEEAGERVNKFTGLAIFASDNISSSAYATEEI